MAKRSTMIAGMILSLVAVCVIGLIFGNALMDYEASHRYSEMIAVFLDPDGTQDAGVLETTVRKIGHLVEYALLGSAVMILILYIKHRFQKSVLGYGLFLVLAVAVLDEYFQSYSDRTSSTEDILLDFLGALIGFFLVCLVVRIYRCFHNAKRKKE